MMFDIIFCTEGDRVMQATAAKLGVEHHAVNVAAGRRVEGPWHVQNVNSYHSRLKGWMHKFKGVSTKYLDSYLGWFRTVDCSPEALHKPASFLTLAMANRITNKNRYLSLVASAFSMEKLMATFVIILMKCY